MVILRDAKPGRPKVSHMLAAWPSDVAYCSVGGLHATQVLVKCTEIKASEWPNGRGIFREGDHSFFRVGAR